MITKMAVDPTKAWALFMSDPVNFLLIMAIVASAAWFIRGFMGKERIAALKERLELASERHTVLTQQIEVLAPEIAQMKEDLAQRKALPNPPRFDKITAVTGAVTKRMNVISQANAALGHTLNVSGGTYHDLSVWPKLLSPSDQFLYAQLLIGGWTLNFNPAVQSSRAQKKISFNTDGTVGEGRNKNEFIWQISNGLLEIYREGGFLQNRFRYDESADRFVCTNDPDAKGIKNQTIYRNENVN